MACVCGHWVHAYTGCAGDTYNVAVWRVCVGTGYTPIQVVLAIPGAQAPGHGQQQQHHHYHHQLLPLESLAVYQGTSGFISPTWCAEEQLGLGGEIVVLVLTFYITS